MHVSARESLAGLDGELQCIAWVACLHITGQKTERGLKSAGQSKVMAA